MAVSPSGLRTINRAEILNIILTEGSVPRVKLSEYTGLNQSTISKITSQLVKQGIVYEAGRDKSPLGRKPVNLRINDKYRIYGLVDIALWTTTIAICDLSGKILEKKEIETIVGKPEKFLDTCAKTLSHLFRSFSIPIAGISVVIPCDCNPRTRI